MLKNHILAFVLGFVLDLILGDPYWMPHPIRLIGTLIAKLEKQLNHGKKKRQLPCGRILVFLVTGITGLTTLVVICGGYLLGKLPGVVIETILSYYILATKCLKVESMKVYHALSAGDVEGARKAVSMIVGRDTSVLDDVGIAKAAIETVAENTSDGIIAPMLYTAIGGPVLGFLYKSINTMDSMVGYKNERYLYFGRTAAKLDDVVNFLPSRISAWLMIAASFLLGVADSYHYSGRQAQLIHKRDCRKHASPNSAQTESTCAGALGIQLAGDAVYFGVVHKKPFIGDPVRDVEYEDIKRANNLLYGTAVLCMGICLFLLGVIAWLF